MPTVTDLRDHRSPEPRWLSSWEFPTGYAHKFSTADAHGSLIPPCTPSRNQMWLPDPPSCCRCLPPPLHPVVTGDRARMRCPLATVTVASLCYDWHCALGLQFFSILQKQKDYLFSLIVYPNQYHHYICMSHLFSPTWTWATNTPGRDLFPITEAY